MRETGDEVEKIGVDRSRKKLERSAVIFAVFDLSRELSDEDMELIELCEGKTVIPIINKTDLEKRADISVIENKLGKCVAISAKDGEGYDELCETVATLIGTKDFVSYMATDSKVTDTVRTVYDAEVTENDGLITFRVRADGFLYNMVRIFVGTLLDVAYGRTAPEDIDKITEAKDRRAAGSTARPEGLFLNKVVY
jgi:tRNA U38,U39,U40 pseudouridine synthase TruA